MDSELGKPGKPNWGLTRRLAARCHHCHGLGRRVSGSARFKSNNKNSERELRGEVEAHGQREIHGG